MNIVIDTTEINHHSLHLELGKKTFLHGVSTADFYD